MASATIPTTIRNLKNRNQVKVGSRDHLESLQMMLTYIDGMGGQFRQQGPALKEHLAYYQAGILTQPIEILMDYLNDRMTTDAMHKMLGMLLAHDMMQVDRVRQNKEDEKKEKMEKYVRMEKKDTVKLQWSDEVEKDEENEEKEMDNKHKKAEDAEKENDPDYENDEESGEDDSDDSEEDDDSVVHHRRRLAVVVPIDLREKCWVNHFGDEVKGKCPCGRIITLIGAKKYYVRSLISQRKGTKKLLKNLIPVCHRCSLSMGSRGAREYFDEFYDVEL